MFNYVFSPDSNEFYPVSLKERYELAGTWPNNAIDVSDEEYYEYNGCAPNDKVRGADDSGRPCWVDAPPKTKEDMVAQADAVKSTLQREAEDAIKPLERAKSLGIATQRELSLLTEWERYSVLLMRVDTSLAPNIEWPQKPQ